MGIPLLKGRTFAELDTFEAPTVAIINETLAKRYFPDDDPIGQHLAMEGRTPGQPAGPNRPNTSPWTEIVGVVADTRKLNLNADTIPEVYVPYWQYPMQTPELLLRTTSPIASTTAAIRNELKAINKNLPVPGIQTFDQMISDVIAQPRFQATLLTLFGAMALLLSAVGIYGVTAYTVSQRVHEIGIRMALGASPKHVLKLIVTQGMVLVSIGIAVGLASSLALTRVMSSLLFSVSATDPMTFTAVVVLLAGVALGACLAPARRAIKIDPMTALRHE
jgi:putative ABC transport system permease protein